MGKNNIPAAFVGAGDQAPPIGAEIEITKKAAHQAKIAYTKSKAKK
jgi:hypothetical protein